MKKNSTFKGLLLAFTAIFAVSPLTASQPSFFVKYKKPIIAFAIVVTGAAAVFYFKDALLGKKSVGVDELNDGIVIFPEDTVKKALEHVNQVGVNVKDSTQKIAKEFAELSTNVINSVKKGESQSSEGSAIKEILKAELEEHVNIFPEGSVEGVLNEGKQVVNGSTWKDLKKKASKRIDMIPDIVGQAVDKVNQVIDGSNSAVKKANEALRSSTMSNMDQQVANFQKEHNLKKTAQV